MAGAQAGRFASRLAKARQTMHTHGLDYLVVGPSADLTYLTGAQSRATERLTLFMLPQEGPAFMVLPAFEAPTLAPLPGDVQMVTWDESDNPARIAARLLAASTGEQPGGMHCTIGVADRLWSVFLLRLQSELPRAAFTSASPVLTALRQIKDSGEVELLAASGRVADDVFTEIVRRRFEGRTEKSVAQEIASLLKDGGLDVEGLPIVASGPNSASPHHHSGERPIRAGDVVVLDFGGTLGGYYSDITRTVSVEGRPSEGSEEDRVYRLVQQAQEAAFQAARPGMTCEQLDAVARKIIAQGGYGEYFNHRLGHGIGLDGHEPPYLVEGNSTPLQPGMAFTIEPGIYLPDRFGVRIEDTVVLEESGARRMNDVTREIVTVA